jgi:hypothetical protein
VPFPSLVGNSLVRLRLDCALASLAHGNDSFFKEGHDDKYQRTRASSPIMVILLNVNYTSTKIEAGTMARLSDFPAFGEGSRNAEENHRGDAEDEDLRPEFPEGELAPKDF